MKNWKVVGYHGDGSPPETFERHIGPCRLVVSRRVGLPNWYGWMQPFSSGDRPVVESERAEDCAKSLMHEMRRITAQLRDACNEATSEDRK